MVTRAPVATAPYSGLRVIEVATDPAGELTGLQFVHLGADVVKVEPPDGSPSRRTGPFVDDAPDVDRSLPYWYYNGGKRSVVLDLADDGDRGDFDRLVDDADLLIITLHPRDLEALGIDLSELSTARPSLVIVSITPFGLTGPWSHFRGSDLVGLAAGGLLIMSGYDDHSIPPIRPGGDQGFHTAASFAHMSAALALLDRQRTGVGALVDVSMQAASAVSVEMANPYWFYPRALVGRQTCRHAQPTPTQPAIFQCADGRWVYFTLILAEQKPWNALVEWMGEHDVADDLTDEAYSGLPHRQSNFSHIQELLEVFFILQDSATAYREGQARGLPIGTINAPEDLYVDEHLKARGFFVEVDQPGHGSVVHPGVPYRFSALATVKPRSASRLGEHSMDREHAGLDAAGGRL